MTARATWAPATVTPAGGTIVKVTPSAMFVPLLSYGSLTTMLESALGVTVGPPYEMVRLTL